MSDSQSFSMKDYIRTELIGSGLTADVYKFVSHENGHAVAVKVFKCKDSNIDINKWICKANKECQYEYEIMDKFGKSDYIMNPLGYSLGSMTYSPFIVMPLCQCDLSSLRKNKQFATKFKSLKYQSFRNDLIQKLAISMFRSMNKMNDKGYMNTDIKSKNIFVNFETKKHKNDNKNNNSSSDENNESNQSNNRNNNNKRKDDDSEEIENEIVLNVDSFDFIMGDLGSVIKLPSNSSKKQRVTYTPSNSAPEVMSQSKLDRRTPMWSVGCVLFEFIFGVKPFWQVKDIVNGNIVVSNWKQQCDKINPKLTHLLTQLLQVNVEKRLKIEDALYHPFCMEKKEKEKRNKERIVNNMLERSNAWNSEYSKRISEQCDCSKCLECNESDCNEYEEYGEYGEYWQSQNNTANTERTNTTTNTFSSNNTDSTSQSNSDSCIQNMSDNNNNNSNNNNSNKHNNSNNNNEDLSQERYSIYEMEYGRKHNLDRDCSCWQCWLLMNQEKESLMRRVESQRGDCKKNQNGNRKRMKNEMEIMKCNTYHCGSNASVSGVSGVNGATGSASSSDVRNRNVSKDNSKSKKNKSKTKRIIKGIKNLFGRGK